MCYSAQVAEAHRQYMRLTGAQIDLLQFVRLYGIRNTDPLIRIPRCVDRWFDLPANDQEREIATLIEQRRSAETAKLERELFALRKRVADAERILATKPTKAAAESKRIAGGKSERAMQRLERLKDSKPHASDARIFPMQWAPIVVQAGERRVIRLARYHCRQPGTPASIDRQYPGLYNARRDNLEKFWRGEFGQCHAVMLADSFFENVQRDGHNAVLHFVPRPAETMLIACLYSEWKDPQDGAELLSFAAITDEPPPEVAAAGHDRMIVSLKPENLDRWLRPSGRSDEELQTILSDRASPYYTHEVLAA